MSSADGWLVEGESPKQAPGLCREKRRPKTGEGRAYTQNPTTAQARGLARGRGFPMGAGRLPNSPGAESGMQDPQDALDASAEDPGKSRTNRSEGACSRLTGLGASCSGVLA